MSHDQLKTLVTQDVEPGTAYKAGDEWQGLADQMRDAAITLDAAINGSQSHWEGAAADLARAHLAKVRDWSADTAQYFNATGTAMHDQVDAAAKAKADMPDPIEYNPGKMLAQAATNPISLIALPAEMYLTHEASNDAKNKAVQVIQARDASMQSASSSIPAFTPPPDLSGGSTANTQLASAGPVGAGGGVAAYHGTSGGGSYGGSGYNPATGGGGYHAAQPGGPVPGGYNPNQVGGPGGGPTRLAGYDPGPGGPGFNGPNYGNTPGAGGPNSPYGPGGAPAIGLAGGAGGGEGGGGYRGGAGGPGSTSSASAKPGMGSSTGTGAAGEGGSGARGGMGAQGSVGQSGMGAGGAGRGGKKEEDKEHKRPTFLVETDDVFGDGQMVAPTVIGENPSGGY
ncbi:WXG100 family type VII secretion target [Kutzneria sp. CA-103260]|uniref:WXG100 family type VII secretion target n=1 Tax=Kutzneria sp. CA-103260 TaxID=2802641 RepID=UPI001BAC8D47|nr:PPE domain-containing protein [Kutzneria sp. CA-103260]